MAEQTSLPLKKPKKTVLEKWEARLIRAERLVVCFENEAPNFSTFQDMKKQLFKIHKFIYSVKFSLTLIPPNHLDKQAKETFIKRLIAIDQRLSNTSPAISTSGMFKPAAVQPQDTLKNNNDNKLNP